MIVEIVQNEVLTKIDERKHQFRENNNFRVRVRISLQSQSADSQRQRQMDDALLFQEGPAVSRPVKKSTFDSSD